MTPANGPSPRRPCRPLAIPRHHTPRRARAKLLCGSQWAIVAIPMTDRVAVMVPTAPLPPRSRRSGKASRRAETISSPTPGTGQRISWHSGAASRQRQWRERPPGVCSHPPIFLDGHEAAGGRSTQSPNPAALPASMDCTPEGRRRVIGTQWEAASACALAVASHGRRLRPCAGRRLCMGNLCMGGLRMDTWAACAWTTSLQSSHRQAARAYPPAGRQSRRMPTADPGHRRHFLPDPNSLSRTACASPRALHI